MTNRCGHCRGRHVAHLTDRLVCDNCGFQTTYEGEVIEPRTITNGAPPYERP
jgi:hypothetical protein